MVQSCYDLQIKYSLICVLILYFVSKYVSELVVFPTLTHNVVATMSPLDMISCMLCRLSSDRFVILSILCLSPPTRARDDEADTAAFTSTDPVPLQEDVSESSHNIVVESPPTIDFATEFVPATSEIVTDQSVHEVHR